MSEELVFEYEKKENEDGSVEINVTVPEESRKSVEKEILDEIRPHVQLKGFRKGKAPDSLIKTRYKEHIETESESSLGQKAWEYASKKEDVRVFGQPKLEKTEKEPQYSFVYKYYPVEKFELPSLEGVTAERPNYKLEDEGIEHGTEIFRAAFAQFKEKEGAAEPGDRVSCDIDFLSKDYKQYNKTDMPFMADDSEKAMLVAKELVGMKAGDEKDIETSINGEKISIRVSVNEVEEKETPEESEEKTEEQKQSDEAFRGIVKGQLEQQLKPRSEEELADDLLDKLIEETNIGIPDGYFKEYLDRDVESLKEEVKRSANLGFDEYLALLGKTEEEIREERKEPAAKAIRRDVLLGEVLKKNEEEIDIDENKINTMAEQAYRQQQQNGLDRLPKEMQQQYVQMIFENARVSVTTEAVIDFLKKKVKVSDKAEESYMPTEEEMNKLASKFMGGMR